MAHTLSTLWPEAGLGLLLLSALLGMHKLASDNGLLKTIQKQAATRTTTLPNSKIPLKTTWLGIPPIDRFFSFMVLFFAAIGDKRNLGLYLQGLHFFGQLMSTWILVLLETYRSGNAGYLVSRTSLFGLLMEFAGVGFILPVWALLHLTTSPAAAATASSAGSGAALLPSLLDAQKLPWAFAIGAVIPAVLMTTLPLRGSGVAGKQVWMIARLFHPLFTVIAQTFLTAGSAAPPVDASTVPATLKAIDRLYLISAVFSALTHVGITGRVLALRARSKAKQPLRISDVWNIVPFWRGGAARKQLPSTVWGISAFLTWDEIATVGSVVVWALALNLRATNPSTSELLYKLARTAAVTALAGPGAAAVTLLRERDGAVLGGLGSIGSWFGSFGGDASTVGARVGH